ncbi:hypothetical protein ACFE04_018631 [Oxalis oulophora]
MASNKAKMADAQMATKFTKDFEHLEGGNPVAGSPEVSGHLEVNDDEETNADERPLQSRSESRSKKAQEIKIPSFKRARLVKVSHGVPEATTTKEAEVPQATKKLRRKLRRPSVSTEPKAKSPNPTSPTDASSSNSAEKGELVMSAATSSTTTTTTTIVVVVAPVMETSLEGDLDTDRGDMKVTLTKNNSELIVLRRQAKEADQLMDEKAVADLEAEKAQQAKDLEEAWIDVANKGKEIGGTRAEVKALKIVVVGATVASTLSRWESDGHRRLHPYRVKLKAVTPEYANE